MKWEIGGASAPYIRGETGSDRRKYNSHYRRSGQCDGEHLKGKEHSAHWCLEDSCDSGGGTACEHDPHQGGTPSEQSRQIAPYRGTGIGDRPFRPGRSSETECKCACHHRGIREVAVKVVLVQGYGAVYPLRAVIDLLMKYVSLIDSGKQYACHRCHQKYPVEVIRPHVCSHAI